MMETVTSHFSLESSLFLLKGFTLRCEVWVFSVIGSLSVWFLVVIQSCLINTGPHRLYTSSTKCHSTRDRKANPKIAFWLPAEIGTLECSNATEDHSSAAAGWFGTMVGGGSGRKLGHLWCRFLPWLLSIYFNSNRLPTPPPFFFAPCPPARSPSSLQTLCARPTPPATLQAGQSDKTIAGPLARELAESISSQ